MCGLLGYLNKRGEANAPVGEILYKMATGLCRRGPDSAGVALYSAARANRLKLRVKLGEQGDLHAEGRKLVETVSRLTRVVESETLAEYQRLVIEDLPVSGKAAAHGPELLEKTIEAVAPQFEVVSLGRSLEIVKQVGSPENLNATYPFRNFLGTHGIGHTRLSTESRVDLSHSQPFWAHGILDLATVHNGHITNYHKLRRQYEQRGIRFYTENDSEIIGKYLADRLSEGLPLEEVLKASLLDLDGSFCYLVATADRLAYVKDPFGFKPLLVVETEDFVAIATEEVALRTWVDSRHEAREAGTSDLRIWQLSNQPMTVEA
jgi:methylamine---glutamate N-methyltransferase subunit A